ncbi:MAG TPA: pyridoxamine 5'-phosphate oxidase family protein [Rariglobus sp.]|jgi:predicted pyridoxine 5'-phosphate oxidase superfamily flavin-nucleotide-binding protein|nr:pyridoxamine 5'-phosphate oxidase family protein [Rariglobus sp.]
MAHQFRNTTSTAAVLRAQEAYYGRSQPIPPSAVSDELGDDEASFIGERDSFYLASVNEDGWPYIQHRGGPRGFLKVIDRHTLGFADLGGNRQLLTTGNVTANDRVALFLMDYPHRARLKIIGHAVIVPAQDDPALAASVTPAGVPPRSVERVFRINVTGFDWNCSKHITPRFTPDDIEKAIVPLMQRIADLEAQLKIQSQS